MIIPDNLTIRRTKEFESIEDCDASNFFIDLEETVLENNNYYDMVQNQDFIDFLSMISGKFSINELISYGRNRKRSLMDVNIPFIIERLKKKKSKVFALTSGYPSKFKVNRLRELRVFFNGFLWTKGRPKGDFLVSFLNRYPNLSGNCCFIDNHIDKIKDVGLEFNKNFPNRKIYLYLYEKIISKDVKFSDFAKYWKETALEVLFSEKR